MAVIELARVDGSMSTFLMVHNSLTMLTIGLLGSEAQKAELLPPMARLDWVGAQPLRGVMCCRALAATAALPTQTPCWCVVRGSVVGGSSGLASAV